MVNLFEKIPVVKELIKYLKKRNFKRRWRKLNAHNSTVVGDRIFPINNVEVGIMSYGALNIQSIYQQEGEKLSIGSYVSIAPGATFLLGVNHQMQTLTTFPLYSLRISRSNKDALVRGPIIVEDEVWIGTNAIILSGITIGKGAIVAAGSVVTKNVPPYAIVAGNPAKVIKFKFSQEIIEILKPIYLKDISEGWISENIEIFYTNITSEQDAMVLKEKILKSKKG